MRESVFFELRLRRFGVWQVAVAVVGTAALSATAAWAWATWDSQPASGQALVAAIAVGLSLATLGLALALGRVEAGLLTCRDGVWAFTTDKGGRRSGALEVAIDLGAFLLLRIADGRRTRAWLPIQRRGLEADWHALRCAVYSPPPHAAAPLPAPALPSE